MAIDKLQVVRFQSKVSGAGELSTIKDKIQKAIDCAGTVSLTEFLKSEYGLKLSHIEDSGDNADWLGVLLPIMLPCDYWNTRVYMRLGASTIKKVGISDGYLYVIYADWGVPDEMFSFICEWSELIDNYEVFDCPERWVKCSDAFTEDCDEDLFY